jgi:hypothetical protein
MQLGDEMNVTGGQMDFPTGEELGLGAQANMRQGIKYDPYKTPSLKRYPVTEMMYQNMFDPNAAARRMDMRSQMLNITPRKGF